MAKESEETSQSRYRGVRVTLTESPDGNWGYVTVSVKHVSGRWSEWNLLMPAQRLVHSHLADTGQALRVMGAAIEAARRDLI